MSYQILVLQAVSCLTTGNRLRKVAPQRRDANLILLDYAAWYARFSASKLLEVNLFHPETKDGIKDVAYA